MFSFAFSRKILLRQAIAEAAKKISPSPQNKTEKLGKRPANQQSCSGFVSWWMLGTIKVF